LRVGKRDCAERRGHRVARLLGATGPWMLVALSLVLISSCSSNSPSASAPNAANAGTASGHTSLAPASLARISVVAGLGDSVPAGTACNCRPYPQLVASDIARITGHEVMSFNDAVAGARSNDVLLQLQSDTVAAAHVATANAVLIEVGANDIAFSSTCGTKVSCYEQTLPQVTRNITAIVSRVRQLASGRSLAVVLLDYWSVWLGGRYAQARGSAYVEAGNSLTRAFSDAIQSVARSTGSIYVDLRTAFRGPGQDRDDTNLLTSDGDHPDAEGHERIANAIVQATADA
jgi:acyl-CoA thioesterase-1